MTYSDGHTSERVVEVPGPDPDLDDDLDDWFNEVVFDYTGDGHGLDSSLGSCYTATIVDASDPDYIGKSYEWTD